MINIGPEILEKDDPASIAFIFYAPSVSKTKEKIFFNQEAFQILSMRDPANTEETFNPSIISSLCSKWRAILQDKIIEKSKDNPDARSKAIYIDILISYRRRYAVKGVVLSASEENNIVSYIFTLERFVPKDMHLLKIFRQYNLSHREQEIAGLLLLGEGNKQIAYALGLSTNTIKSYMKLLMKKLNVSNRAGIVAALLKDG